MSPPEPAFWSLPAREQLNRLLTSAQGLSSREAQRRLAEMSRSTEFGAISEHLRLRPPETEFERGVRKFSYFLMEVTLVLVIAIFAVNVFFRDHAQHPVLHAFMFSLALAVGLTPQLLPAIISVNLAHGAKKMAENQVIVRRLSISHMRAAEGLRRRGT